MKRQALGVLTLLLLAVGAVVLAVRPGQAPSQEDPYAEDRQRLLTGLRAQGIRDERVLAAMARVPRHRFVPEEYRARAWEDTALPIGLGQTISQPLVVALMTQALGLQGREKVLEIGTGSGYQAAVLAEVAASVFSIEILPELGQRARQTLDELGYQRVQTRIGDGYLGWPEEAPFDAILVTAAPDHVPQPLVEQLAEGGRMVLPVGPEEGIQTLRLLTRKGEEILSQDLERVRFVPLVRPSP
ncbi:MAG TPA: protein-L-isoaspartate(D-aspartate) O-methyltransferase [Candidatus Nitrosotenuis sp.]|nr:protein-L-isoaspartate(D-aspartate) O-methyltransferase [Candidatus Nitrosotenuis sp.]